METPNLNLPQEDFIIITAKILHKMEDLQKENEIENEMIEGSNERKIAKFIQLCKLYLTREGILFLMMKLPGIETHRIKILDEIEYFDTIPNSNPEYMEITTALKQLLLYIYLGINTHELLAELDKED